MALRLTEEEYQALIARRRAAGDGDIAPTGRRRAAGDGDIAPTGERKAAGGERKAKYGNRRVVVDGMRFDSQHEAEVYGLLRLRLRAGEIRLLLRQVSFDLPGGIRYVADFVTLDSAGALHVIDAKSEATKANRVYINKRKQMKSEWDIEIEEV